jgi:hypothetical protein
MKNVIARQDIMLLKLRHIMTPSFPKPNSQKPKKVTQRRKTKMLNRKSKALEIFLTSKPILTSQQ